jgi:hypothetical protein
MHYLHTILFVISCFSLIVSWFVFNYKVACRVFRGGTPLSWYPEFNVPLFGAAASFAYMMTYLFIW